MAVATASCISGEHETPVTTQQSQASEVAGSGDTNSLPDGPEIDESGLLADGIPLPLKAQPGPVRTRFTAPTNPYPHDPAVWEAKRDAYAANNTVSAATSFADFLLTGKTIVVARHVADEPALFSQHSHAASWLVETQLAGPPAPTTFILRQSAMFAQLGDHSLRAKPARRYVLVLEAAEADEFALVQDDRHRDVYLTERGDMLYTSDGRGKFSWPEVDVALEGGEL